jgi:hypothetical protein
MTEYKKYTTIADVTDKNHNIPLGRYYGNSYESLLEARADIRVQLQRDLKTLELDGIEINRVEEREEELVSRIYQVYGDFGWAIISATSADLAIKRLEGKLGMCEIPIDIGRTADTIYMICSTSFR